MDVIYLQSLLKLAVFLPNFNENTPITFRFF